MSPLYNRGFLEYHCLNANSTLLSGRCAERWYESGTERERERVRERERERNLLGTIHNGGSRVASAHGLRITTLGSASPHTLDGAAAAYMAKTFPGL